MKKKLLKVAVTVLLLATITNYNGLKAADIFSTTATGTYNWNSAATWVGGVVPTTGDNVFIESGVTITLNIAATINDLNLCIDGGGTRLSTGSNTLQVSGKLRAYTGVAPGTNSGAPNPTIISAGATGKIRLIGDSRTIVSIGEWGANPRNYTVEFALNAGQIGTCQSKFKCGDLVVVSGEMVCNDDLRLEKGAGTNTGSITVQNNARLRLGSNVNIQRVEVADATSHIGSISINSGGTLEFSGATVGVIGASTINFNGTVSYTNGAAQTLVTRGANTAGADPFIYTNLTLQESAKTLAGNTTVNGTLNMSANTAAPSLNLGPYTLTYGATATLQYSSINTIAQTTADTEWPDIASSASKPFNVDFFNANGVTLNNNKSLLGDAKLSGALGINCKVNLGVNNLIANTVTRINPDANKYFITNGTGKLFIRNINTIPVLFPVGPSAVNYNPATITNAGTLDNFGVNVAAGTPLCGNTITSAGITFDISESVVGGSNATLSLNFAGASNAALITTTGTIAHCDGSTLDYSNGSTTGTVTTGSGFTNFSPFFINDNIILPVTITSFTANFANNKVNLNWAVAHEQNIGSYIIERSANGVLFNEITSATATRANNYTVADEVPLRGSNYYRLKIVEQDGSSNYSSIVKVDIASVNTGIKVYPTITNNNVNLISNTSALKKYQVINAMGKLIQTGTFTISTIISLTGQPAGVYQIKIESESFRVLKN